MFGASAGLARGQSPYRDSATPGPLEFVDGMNTTPAFLSAPRTDDRAPTVILSPWLSILTIICLLSPDAAARSAWLMPARNGGMPQSPRMREHAAFT